MLEFEGYQPDEAASFEVAVQKGVEFSYDLVLLDLVLPGGDGLDVLKQIRTARPTIPFIILSAKGQESDRVSGLKIGADDYMVKPFSVKELLARIEAVLRRSAERPSDVSKVPIPGGVADLELLELRFEDGQKSTLSARECDLLRYLSLYLGRVISREELLTQVRKLPSYRGRTRTVDMHIARLREKLRDVSEEPQLICTVRGKGYLFKGVS